MKLKHYLIASEENDYQPVLTKPIALAVFMVIIWSLRILGPSAVTYAQSSIDAQDLMTSINSERTQRFVPALLSDQRLVSAAGIKSNDMLDRSYFAHLNPDGSYVWPTIEVQGYRPYLTLGENLAMDFVSGDAVVRAWMNSPTHRENIVNEKFQDQGLAAIFGLFEPNHNSILITSLFGTLLNQNPTPAIAQATAPPTSSPPTAQQDTKQPIEQPIIPSEASNTEQIETESITTPADLQIPVSREAQFLNFFRIIVAILAGIYAMFLIIDSIIIHRAKIKRINMHASPHTVIFLLIVVTSLFVLY
ncbi:MAG: hypothetical protein HYW51_01715 [Candidatus Doudnabacteria bacterium]|nr:hypothetical protein [Candidatus Doudnabacteria bacterium]